jgi:hypothetical protein
MTAWLLLAVHVVAHSRSTQLWLLAAFAAYPALHFLGLHVTASIEFASPLNAITHVIREHLQDRYDHAAWLVVFGFLGLAHKSYRSELRKLVS